MPVSCWNFVVDFGDIAVLAPGTCAICITLWLRGYKREALIWAVAFVGCVAITTFLKATIGFGWFDLLGHRFQVKSPPSGHTTISVAFYGGLAVLLRSALPGLTGRLAVALLAGLIALIAASTVILHWHTGIDVIAGLLLGSVFLLLLAQTARLHSYSPIDGVVVGITAVIVIAVLHGFRLDVKETVGSYNNGMSIDFRREPFCLADRMNHNDVRHAKKVANVADADAHRGSATAARQ